MVNFNPNIYYSDKASKQERYQEAKKKRKTSDQNDQTTTATLILDHFDSEENKTQRPSYKHSQARWYAIC